MTARLLRPLALLAVLASLGLAACGDDDEDGGGGESSPPPAAEEQTETAGDTLMVQYAGVTFSTGEEFDASWNTGEPFTFPLGAGRVIQGWDQGFVGMRRGGRRMLTIPPELAYGAQGFPPAIGPNETLVFVVDLLAIR
jgi:peptidylprolyl isomerase